MAWMRSNSFGDSDMDGILSEGFMGVAFPNLKSPKHRLSISVNIG
jgi:hypothetical protein